MKNDRRFTDPSTAGPRTALTDCPPRFGFSLVELVVVIAITGVLVALLLPAVQKARTYSQQIRCANNLRQLGIALTTYCNNNSDRFPQSDLSEKNIKKTWVYTLAPYVEDVDMIRICPADPNAQVRLANKGTSYVLNEYICVPGPDARLYLSKLSSTSQTITVFTASDNLFFQDAVRSRTWFAGPPGSAWPRFLADVQPDRFGGSLNDLNHSAGMANYLYADGHVQSIPAAQVKNWVESGFNFAEPQ